MQINGIFGAGREKYFESAARSAAIVGIGCVVREGKRDEIINFWEEDLIGLDWMGK